MYEEKRRRERGGGWLSLQNLGDHPTKRHCHAFKEALLLWAFALISLPRGLQLPLNLWE